MGGPGTVCCGCKSLRVALFPLPLPAGDGVPIITQGVMIS